MTEEACLCKDNIIMLLSDLIGSEWLSLVVKPDRTFDEQNLRDRLKRILVADGWNEDFLDETVSEYRAAAVSPAADKGRETG